MPQETINKLLDTIDKSINEFVEGLSPIQQRAYNRLLELTKELAIDKRGNIKRSLNNIRLVNKIKKELDEIVLNKQYLKSVSEFALTFDKVTELQNQYFSTVVETFQPKAVLDELKKVNIDYTIEALTESGIGQGYTDEIKGILRTNITAGGSYADLTDQLRTAIIGKEGEDGKLAKYAKQIATDSINQYNRSYNQYVASDLGLKWYQYIGSNIKTTRPFCLAMTKKRYFHESEIPSIINGNIDGQKVSTAGQIEGTNKNNFLIYAGGWQCGHGIYPVSSETVPEEIRKKFEK